MTVHVRQVHGHRVLAILAVILKAGNPPRPVNVYTILLQVRNEHSFDQTLVQQCGERIAGVDEGGT